MALPGNITISSTQNITTSIYGLPIDGELVYKYSPFQNLLNLNPPVGETALSELRLLSSEAGINTDEPIILDIEEAYDGSANLVISDKQGPLKIVNSRFYLISSSEFVVADRKGNMDTNIYTKENFQIEAGLIKNVKSVIGLNFEGVFNGGILPVGNYNFYFKLADFDGNESDIVSESGQVICYIGAVNNPKSIRGGQLNENSEKLVKFKLTNLDLAYDYINIYYTRNTGDELVENITAHKIVNKFKILGTSTTVTITGYEELESLSISDLNLRYSTFDHVKTLATCQNMVFAGNIHNNYELFTMLEKYSLFITPKLSLKENIGNLSSTYIDNNSNANEYYNPNNIYYRLGFWDEEIYRLGIVYILNDFSLSPVFNIRGKREINEDSTFEPIILNSSDIDCDENYSIIFNGEKTNENIKGVFRINTSTTNTKIFNGNSSIKPIGIKLNFNESIINGSGIYPALSKITKGFFIVRQKRIPTILAQGLSIGTSKKGYIPAIKNNSGYMLESFLKRPSKTDPVKLERTIYHLPESLVNINALLCPEASIRKTIYSSLFNSSSFNLRKTKYQPNRKWFFNVDTLATDYKLYSTDTLIVNEDDTKIDTSLLLVDSDISLINNKNTYFSSVAGNAIDAWKHTDPINDDVEKITFSTDEAENTELSNSPQKTRGIFNSYIGTSENLGSACEYYNIYNKDYDTEDTSIDNYFKIRYNDSSPFFPISDRIGWSSLVNKEIICYRGDCYINTYTHRMMWNFIDPELPTNHRIVDPYTWYKNYKVKNTLVKISKDFVIEDNNNQFSTTEPLPPETVPQFSYKKVLNAFTYKTAGLSNDIDEGTNLNDIQLITPESKKYKKYSESNGEFGVNKINRADINAVGLGHWATFKICSNINLALRDEDFSNPAEEALHKKKRSFYPYSSADIFNPLPESNIINKGISSTLGNRYYFEIPDVPFIKTHFTNRIHYSNLLIDSVFKDGSRIFEASNYQDYTLEYGQLIKLVEWYGSLIAIMEHGVLMIPVNERSMMKNETGENIYVNTGIVLPKNPRVLSNTYGSTWSTGIVKTPRYIYGIDTIGKKVWRTNGESLELISDMKIQKFLNDNLLLKVTDNDTDIINHLVKVHYNAFKQDVIFVFKYALIEWVLCWNEISNTWVTRYTWFPEFSENINNLFYTFANKIKHPNQYGKLFKHGWAGTLEEQGYIKPTVWYEEQHPFEFEFVIAAIPGVQKIYNNLKLISNKAEPNSFTYEIVGEGYDWYKYKEVISWMENHASFNTGFITEELNFIYSENGYYTISQANPFIYEDGYEYLLTHSMIEIETTYPDFPRPYGMGDNEYFSKLPYIPKVKIPSPLDTVDFETLGYDSALIYDSWNGEDRVLSYQKGKAMNKPEYGRLRGNMHYVEDSWDIQIQPLKIRYAFMKDSTLTFTEISEMKIRDKYTKIRVKYDGKKLAIISAIKNLFTISYA